jgi:hypothetical protein
VIEPFDDCRLVPLQPIQRTRHRATYEFMVENHGNTVASCRLHLVDPTDRVDGDFDPPAVGVGPGSSALVRLKARASHGGFRRGSRTLDFEVEASRQGLDPVSTSMSMIQSPTIPAAAVARTAAVLALVAAIMLAWFAVVRPTIENAAADQVDERFAELSPVGSGDPAASATTVPPSDGGTSESAGTPTFVRLEVQAPLTQTADQSTTLPEGASFDLTDVRIENPYGDRGVATLLVNTVPILIWSLENVRGSLFEPRITPIRLGGGDNVTFSVRCDEIGDTSRSTCTNAVNITGLSIPAEG